MSKEEFISFYSIVPIFEYGIINTEFLHKGKYNNSQFSISFKKYANSEEVFKNAHASIHSKLRSIHIHSNHCIAPADNFLIIEVTCPYEEELEVAANTMDMHGCSLKLSMNPSVSFY